MTDAVSSRAERAARSRGICTSVMPSAVEGSVPHLCCSSGGNRAGGNQLLAGQVHAQVEALEAVRAEQYHVSRLREHDDRWRRTPAGVDHREPDAALEYPAVRRLEAVCSY